MLRIQQINRFRHLCRPFTVSLKQAKNVEITPDVAEEDYVVNVMSFEEQTNRTYGQFKTDEVSFIWLSSKL